jgi:hypothetical protein
MINTYQPLLPPQQQSRESRRYSNSPYARNYCPETASQSKPKVVPKTKVVSRNYNPQPISHIKPEVVSSPDSDNNEKWERAMIATAREETFGNEYCPSIPQEQPHFSAMSLLAEAAQPKEELDRIKRRRNTESAQRYECMPNVHTTC